MDKQDQHVNGDASLVHDTFDYSSINERALIRKIDFRVIPPLFLIYVLAFLDRVNISNALTLGLPKDLHLTGQQPNAALAIFFVPYVLFEIPSNLIMKRVTPRIWLPGFQNYSGLLATRFFLGLAEAGVFPGSFYVISSWYKREEAQRRFTVYWCSVLVATMFGGLLASAIANMDGIRGYRSWRWIFILEGILTIVLSAVSHFWVSGFPDNVRWLDKEEKEFVIARSQIDSVGSQPVSATDILKFFTEPRNILAGVIYFAFAYFAPTIIRTLKYTTVQTQLHTVPPVAAALALCLITAYASDRLRLRSPFIAFCIALTITGLAILLTVHNNFHVQYAAIFLVAMGAFTGGPIVVCWVVMNLRGHRDRSIGTAWVIGFGNTGGIVATFCFMAKDAPTYRTGYAICMGATCLGAVTALMYAALALLANRGKRDAEERLVL
ncbi:MAG: hypothetical protein Q9167_005308 [Letrouitia subvulpina]